MQNQKWPCDTKSNSHSGRCRIIPYLSALLSQSLAKSDNSGCKKDQQADFEVQLENKITLAGH